MKCVTFELFIAFFCITVFARVVKSDCPRPSIRPNVEMKYPDNVDRRGPFKEYTTLSFYCKRGFLRLRGHTTAVCMKNRWNTIDDDGNVKAAQPLTCREKPCPARTPANGMVKVEDKQITYSCERGYELKGQKVSYCRLNRQTNYYVVHPMPQCLKLKECEYPQQDKLDVQNDCCYGGDKVDFTCEPDYRLEGSSSLTCNKDGNWNGAFPKCILIPMCKDPGNATYGNREGDCCEVGSVLNYSCPHGYEFVNHQQGGSITCLPNKQWSGDKPKCKPVGSPTCPDIPLTENNLMLVKERTSDVYLPGDEVELNCLLHYTTEAETMSLFCQDNGQWDSSIPVCEPLSPCKRPPHIEHGIILEMVENPAQEFPVDFEINIVCDENYEIKSTNYGSRCKGDDVWENVISNCTLIECKDPGMPPYAVRHGDNFHIGRNVSYSCLGDMELIGSATRTCLETKRWSGSTPVCDSKGTDCHDPGFPHNSQRIGSSFNVGDVVKYTCLRNHIMIGNDTRVCTESGEWTGSEISCLGPDEYSDKEMVAEELEGTMTQVARMSESSIPMSALVRSGGLITDNMKGVNVYFVFDASGSITKTQFTDSKELAKALIRKVGISGNPGGVRVGIIVFGKEAHVKVYPATDKKTNDVLEKINNMEREGQGTNIVKAMEKLLDLIAVTKRNPDRKNCKDVAFIMTDGNANEGGQPTSQASELHRRKVDVYVVTIGNKVHQPTLLIMTNKKPEKIIKLNNHKEMFNLFSTVVGNHFDYSPCGLDRIKLFKDDPSKGQSKRSKRSAMLTRIVGGKAVKYAWPWMAAIYIRNETGITFQCGGSIIHTNWILTAAHCFVIAKEGIIEREATDKMLDSKKWLVSVGRTHQDDKDTGLDLYVQKVVVHEVYDPSDLKFDIALIQLRSAIHYDIYTRPICLPPPIHGVPYLYKPKENAVVIGWGHNETYFLNKTVKWIVTNTLQELMVPLQPESVCNKIVTYPCPPIECKIKPSTTTLCAGTGKGGEDSCKGDSGGPLMQFVKSNSSGLVEKRWFQVGVVSWGAGCGMPDHYGYYSHVARVRDWIVNTTGIEFEEPLPLA